MRETVYSAAAAGIFDNRSSSRNASFCTGSRHTRGFDLLAQLLDLPRLLVAFPELLLNGFELLAKEVLALVLPDLGLDLRLDLGPQLQDLELLDQDSVQLVHPRADVERLEHLLFGLGRDGRETRRDEVGQLPGLGRVSRKRLQIVGQQGRQGHDLLKVVLDVPLERVDLKAILVLGNFFGQVHVGQDARLGLDDPVELDAGQPLYDETQTSIGQLEHLVDVRHRPNRVQVFLSGLLDSRIALSEHANQLALSHRPVDQTNGALARHRKWHERVGEQDGITERKNR